MLDSERLKVNSERWARLHPTALNLVRQTPDRVHLVTNPNGTANLQTTIKGKSCYYHSTEDPVAEANGWFNQLNLHGLDVLYVFGLGLGYAYEAAKGWLKQNEHRFLVFIENDIEVFHCLLQTERGTEMLGDKQVWLWYMDSNGANLTTLAIYFVLRDYALSALPLYERHYLSEYQKVRSRLTFHITMHRAAVLEYSGSGKGFLSNFFNNILRLPESHYGNALFGCFKDIPAIICGAGPSLGKNLDVLSTLRNKALIFAGGTAMNAVNAKALLPHFGVALDPNPAQFARLIMNQAFEIPYFYRNRVQQDVLKLIQGDKLYLTGSGGHEIARWFEEKLKISDVDLSEGFNVINFSVGIAAAMGCNPIILVGVDLAYSNNQSYSPGIVNHPLHERSKHFRTKSADDELISAKDINGSPVVTLWKWIAEADWFSQFAKRNPGIAFFNCTEGGLGFDRIPNAPLLTVANTLLTQQYDFDGMIHAKLQAAKIPTQVNLEAIIDAIEMILDSLKTCKELCLDISEDYGEAAQILENNPNLSSQNQSEKGKQAQATLDTEPAYQHLLKIFAEINFMLHTRELVRMKIDEGYISRNEVELKKALISRASFAMLGKIADANARLLDELIRNQAAKTIASSLPVYHERESSKGTYRFENNILTLIDDELGLDIEQPFKPDQSETVQTFYPNGCTESMHYLKEGALHGPYFFYSDKGTLLSERWFIEGTQQGKAYLYNTDGSVATIQRLRNGQWNGRQVYLRPDGSLRSLLPYSDGLLHGDVLLFYPNGKLKRELHFVQGKRQGVERIWNEFETLTIEAHFNADIPTGVARRWHSNGVLAMEVRYDETSGQPLTKEWDEWGSLVDSNTSNGLDFFDKVTLEAGQLAQQIDTLLTAVSSPFLHRADTPGPLNDLTKLQDDLKHLHAMHQKLLYETGLTPSKQEESIWKSPSARREVEQQLELMTGPMKEQMQQLEQTLITTIELLTKKMHQGETPPPEDKDV